MRRWAFNLFCLVSLMIFAASMALWVRSYLRWDNVIWSYNPTPLEWRGHYLRSSMGAVMLGTAQSNVTTSLHYAVGWEFRPQHFPVSLYQFAAQQNDVDSKFAGIHALSYRVIMPNVDQAGRSILIPIFYFLPFGIPPVVWWRKRRKNRGRGFPLETEAAVASKD